jgi:hypothetical protein
MGHAESPTLRRRRTWSATSVADDTLGETMTKKPRTLKSPPRNSFTKGTAGSTRTDGFHASATMETDADSRNATSNMPAAGVAPRTTTLRPIINKIPITTRLKPEAWKDLLSQVGILEEYSHIPIGLSEGFLIGVENHDIKQTYIARNHFCTEAEAEIIRTKFSDEIALGRISQAFDPVKLEEAIGPYRTAPMAVVIQNKPCIVIDSSHPRNEHALEILAELTSQPLPTTTESLSDTSSTLPFSHIGGSQTTPIPIDPSNISINSLIDSDNYQCNWGTFSDCYLLVADAPEGTHFTNETKSQLTYIIYRNTSRRI